MIKKIIDIANKMGIEKENLFIFNNHMAKILPIDKLNKGKLIVITSTNPTPEGEGKTTLALGLVDLLNENGFKTIGALREPSMGPLFGLKGGATGGGKCMMFPANKINMHFTGDFHAITAANNLIVSVIENEIYFDSQLKIDPNKIIWKRCVDANDRGLRQLDINIKKNIKYETGFNITAASDLMTLFCLVNNIEEFKHNLNQTIVAYDINSKPIMIKNLKIIDALMEILEDAFKPNLVQTINGNPLIIHGGPFANIAHGCSSIVGTKTSLSYADYVITECGFGSDLGFEKFMNIKMRRSNLYPNSVIICATIKSLIMHGRYDSKNKFLENGFKNLIHHVNNVRNYKIEPLVILNINKKDTINQIEEFKILCVKNNIKFDISNIYELGLNNNKHLLESIMKTIKNNKHNFLYDLYDDPIKKIENIAKKTYGTTQINYSDGVKQVLKNKTLKDFAVCIAKTHKSLTSDPSQLNVPKQIILNIDSVSINYAAKIIVINCGHIIKLPGLPKKPRAINFKQEI